jgi:hypothetical protein
MCVCVKVQNWQGTMVNRRRGTFSLGGVYVCNWLLVNPRIGLHMGFLIQRTRNILIAMKSKFETK